MAAVAGPLADVESMVCLKDLFNSLGCENLFTEHWYRWNRGGWVWSIWGVGG